MRQAEFEQIVPIADVRSPTVLANGSLLAKMSPHNSGHDRAFANAWAGLEWIHQGTPIPMNLGPAEQSSPPSALWSECGISQFEAPP
jgi:hypothetical protein